MSDQISIDRIAKAHPLVRAELGLIFGEITNRLTGRAKCRLTHVLRTFKEQDDLHRIGRRGIKGEKVVTKARGGDSFHNYGLAADLALILDNKTVSWDTRADFDGDFKSDWMECVEVFKKYGWEWGGDWLKFKDPPHFQKTFGYKVKDLKALHAAGKVDSNGYVIIQKR